MLIKRSLNERHIQHVTPETAGWKYIGFDVYRLKLGDSTTIFSEECESCIVLISGRAKIISDDLGARIIGERISPFEGKPWSVYFSSGVSVQVEATTDLEIAVCSAPAGAIHNSRVIQPDALSQAQRGVTTNVRYATQILWEDEPAHSLLIVEVITPGGHWSSFPPHKHDTDNFPNETQLEEIYYYRFSPPQGFALQWLYRDDPSCGTVVVPRDRDVVLVPNGYHPVSAPHQYDVYYLNVMAGPRRAWKFSDDPQHAWIRK